MPLFLLYSIEGILPQFTPCLCALALTALLVTFTNNFPSEKKSALQFAIFGSIMTGGFAYLLQQSPALLENFYLHFVALPSTSKFALSFAVIGCTYFGGAFYSIGLSGDANEGKAKSNDDCKSECKKLSVSPALADNAVTFEVPANLPANDKEMFEFMLER